MSKRVVICGNGFVLSENSVCFHIDNPYLSAQQEKVLETLEAVIFLTKKRYLFGGAELNPISNLDPNTLSKKDYAGLLKKIYEVLR